ncbi:hypothetical protein JHK84_031265 [Glycine max]|nr:hypothetical protein JHK84_031265 [Glycine max]KHN22065.1 COP9 signalosome complex subunit 5 [Glycine soja]
MRFCPLIKRVPIFRQVDSSNRQPLDNRALRRHHRHRRLRPSRRRHQNSRQCPFFFIFLNSIHVLLQYYALDITYFKSSLDSHLLNLLWNKYWVNMLLFLC